MLDSEPERGSLDQPVSIPRLQGLKFCRARVVSRVEVGMALPPRDIYIVPSSSPYPEGTRSGFRDAPQQDRTDR